jgi:hypothetical protein
MQPLEVITSIANDAFIYGYPVVDNHNVFHKYVMDRQSGEYKAPFNQVGHNRTVAIPDGKAVVSMNLDTPFSFAWLDLRAEPVVLTMPTLEDCRYVSVELIDVYTYIVGYISPRTNGKAGGDFLIAGQAWNGPIRDQGGVPLAFPVPPGSLPHLINRPRRPGESAYDPGQVPGAGALRMDGVTPPPPAPPFADFRPIDVRRESESLQFFTILNAMLTHMLELKEESELRRQFAHLGIIPTAPFESQDEQICNAVINGIHQRLGAMHARAKTVRTSAEIFGSCALLKDDYVSRAVGALLGIYGNAAEEYLEVGYQANANGKAYDGNHKYQIKFAADALLPVDAIGSITACNASKFLIENPINRYVINSPMLPSLKKDPDGGFTLYRQHESPKEGRESNWLPVSQDAVNLAFRTYQPGQAIMDGSWQASSVIRVDKIVSFIGSGRLCEMDIPSQPALPFHQRSL